MSWTPQTLRGFLGASTAARGDADAVVTERERLSWRGWIGVGMVTLAETRIDSSIAAMIAGSVPLQVILLRTLAREGIGQTRS